MNIFKWFESSNWYISWDIWSALRNKHASFRWLYVAWMLPNIGEWCRASGYPDVTQCLAQFGVQIAIRVLPETVHTFRHPDAVRCLQQMDTRMLPKFGVQIATQMLPETVPYIRVSECMSKHPGSLQVAICTPNCAKLWATFGYPFVANIGQHPGAGMYVLFRVAPG